MTPWAGRVRSAAGPRCMAPSPTSRTTSRRTSPSAIRSSGASPTTAAGGRPRSAPRTARRRSWTSCTAGTVLAVGGTTQGAESFAYDGLDRLKTASGPFGVQDFTYDALGNRLSLSTFVLRPNGAGSSAQWARVGCSANWQCVDEVTADGSASYVTTGTNGRKDLYALSNLPISGTIESVTVSALAWGEADDSGCLDPPPCHVIPARVQPLVRTGGTTYAGSAPTIFS